MRTFMLIGTLYWSAVCAKPAPLVSDLHRRQSNNVASLDYLNLFSGFLYTVNISIGTPPQQLMAALDTGSPYLILSNPGSEFCQQVGQPCSTFGSYDPSLSSSAIWISDDMDVIYELSKDSGSWLNDSLTIGDLTIASFPVGTANGSSTADPQNWFGLNGPGSEGPASQASSLQIMAQAGVLESASVGIFSGPLSDSVGQVVFGGLDTSKWQGDVQVLPIVKNDGGQILVSLTSIAVADSNVASPGLPVDVMIDTGNFDIKLPQDIVDGVWAQVDGLQTFNVTVGDTTLPYGVCDCNLAQSSKTFIFGFDGISIEVPISDMVVLPSALLLQNLGVSDFPEDTCVFMINGWGPTPPVYHSYILGDAFLRSAYFILDWDSNEVGLGQANNADSSPNIIPIAAGTSGLRDAISGTSKAMTQPSAQPSASSSDPSPAASVSTAPSTEPTSNSASLILVSNAYFVSAILMGILDFFM
ncbi:hypothetical protein LTR84_000286 [Exophiala bonariae]|uniref:Peptidase A1 domain-containing protein n=1 Tax=Exophiala bonariae TaxID=1690606 RepID=A0AAV9NQH7_9EURO|nr:hypothetical protein LTR84_000286 [Exophiala bonariae]